MKTNFFYIGLVGMLFKCQLVFSQNSYVAKIEKNTNIKATTLVHELNRTKDTLLLHSTSAINHVYSINNVYKREIDKYVSTNNYKLPLQNLSKGKHVLVVSQAQKKIVFVIHIIEALTTVKRANLTYNSNK